MLLLYLFVYINYTEMYMYITIYCTCVSYRDMDKDAFQDGLIRITVRDANMVPFAKKKMIGALSFDTSAIYTGNKSHEMYRQWMALMDDEDGDDVGVQGKLSPSFLLLHVHYYDYYLHY